MNDNDGQEIAAAWKAFAVSDLGEKLLDGDARGKYLANRLEAAFISGWEAARRAYGDHG